MDDLPSVRDSDHALMMGVQNDDRAALQGLLDRYWGPLIAYTSEIVGREDEAEDVVQETFIRVWRYRANWRPSGTVAAYLYRITRNLAFNALRDQRALKKWEAVGVADAHAAAPRNPSELTEAELLRAEVAAAIAALPKRRREAFVLSRFHGLSHREVSQAMGISVPTVANQITTALVQLRAALTEHLGCE